MAENKCTGNCMACTIFQRQFCSSQLAYTNMRMLEQLQQTVTNLQQKIESMQNNEALLFDPTATGPSNIPDNVGSNVGSNTAQ